MSDLENVFGEEFAENYQQEIARRREERQSVDEEIKQEVANLAINEGKFKDGEPQFSVTTESDVTHDVLLVQLPQIEGKSVFSYVNELDTGAVTCPLDYMGEWMSCLFNDPDDLKNMEEGEHYIIIGNLSQWENDKGELQDQVSPVRGVLSLQEAKEMADQTLGDEVNESSSDEEESEEESMDFSDGDEEEEEDDDEGGLDSFSLDDDEDEEDEYDVDYDDVAGVVETLAGKEEAVWDLEEGDDRLDKVTKITVKQLELDEDAFDTVQKLALKRIEEESEDDEDDEESKMF